MSVLGVGLDIVDLHAFGEQLALAGSRFEQGVFTAGERRASRSRPSKDPVQHLAARFAAKEAFVKAWSCALWGRPPAMERADLQEIEVVQDAWGRPKIVLHGKVAAAVDEAWRVHLSLSHDGGMAAATVVISG
jgi:holo-[acyl-carrier protein] synthase